MPTEENKLVEAEELDMEQLVNDFDGLVETGEVIQQIGSGVKQIKGTVPERSITILKTLLDRAVEKEGVSDKTVIIALPWDHESNSNLSVHKLIPYTTEVNHTNNMTTKVNRYLEDQGERLRVGLFDSGKYMRFFYDREE